MADNGAKLLEILCCYSAEATFNILSYFIQLALNQKHQRQSFRVAANCSVAGTQPTRTHRRSSASIKFVQVNTQLVGMFWDTLGYFKHDFILKRKLPIVFV